jgi:hypothetical protein
MMMAISQKTRQSGSGIWMDGGRKTADADGRRTTGESTSLSRDIYGIRRSVILQTDYFSLILLSLPHQLIFDVGFVTVG